jgi:hypothetical protein
MKIYDQKALTPLESAGKAEKHPALLGKFLARYEAPWLGIRYVRNACGRPIIFDIENHAERAAKDALISALNNRPVMIQQRIVIVPRKPHNGRKSPSAYFKR